MTSPGPPRIAALDVVRGFALCGILLVNVQPIANVGNVVLPPSPTSPEDLWIGLLTEQRFFPRTRYGVIDGIERSSRGPALLGLAFAAGAAPALWWQAGDAGNSGSGLSMGVAGLLLAGVYVCALLVLLRTPLRPALQAAFAPLGRKPTT